MNVRYPNLTEYLAVAASVVSSRSRNCVKEVPELFRQVPAELLQELVGRPGLDPGTLGLKGHRVHYSLFIRFREPHINRVLRSVRSVRSARSVAIEKC